MPYTKDYYQILGVMPAAEDIVIRAAYKALAQRYHPDKYQGDPAEAMRIMQEINEAYSILSDKDKRRQYDAWQSQQASGSEYQPEDQDDELNEAMSAYDRDWKTACSIYPDLNKHYLWLNKVAHRLGATYKIFLLETKNFKGCKLVATLMEDDFFKSYFGENVDIISFAKSLVREGQKGAAKSLNNYIRVVGQAVDSRRVIDAVCDKHGIPNPIKIREENLEQERQETVRKWSEEKLNKEATEKLRRVIVDPQYKYSELKFGGMGQGFLVGLAVLFAVAVFILGIESQTADKPMSPGSISASPGDVGKWHFLGEAIDYKVYNDLSTIHKTGNIVGMLTMLDFKSAKVEQGKAVLSVTAQSEFNCEKGQMRDIGLRFYSQNMANSSLASQSHNPSSEWYRVPPGTPMTIMFEFACGKG